MGFFSFIIPLLRFIRLAGNCWDSKLLTTLEFLSAAAAIVAMVLQFTGAVAFSRSVYFFLLWIPLALVLTTAVVARRASRQNIYAGRLLIPVVILTATALLETFNYHVPFTESFFSLFQIGMFVFLFLITVIAGLGLKDSIELKQKTDLLDQEKHILKIQTHGGMFHSTVLLRL